MEKILEEKQLPKECNRQEARRLQARMVRRKDHDCVVEETIRREALEPPDCEAMKKEYGKTLAQKHLNEKEQQKWSIGFKIQFNTWFCELGKLLLLWFCEAKLHDRKILSKWRNCQVWLLREQLKARLTSIWHWSCQVAWISSWTVWSNFTCHPLLQLKMCWTEIATHWLKMCFHTQCCWGSARGMEIPNSMESGTPHFHVTFCWFRPNAGQMSQSDDNLAGVVVTLWPMHLLWVWFELKKSCTEIWHVFTHCPMSMADRLWCLRKFPQSLVQNNSGSEQKLITCCRQRVPFEVSLIPNCRACIVCKRQVCQLCGHKSDWQLTLWSVVLIDLESETCARVVELGMLAPCSKQCEVIIPVQSVYHK